MLAYGSFAAFQRRLLQLLSPTTTILFFFLETILYNFVVMPPKAAAKKATPKSKTQVKQAGTVSSAHEPNFPSIAGAKKGRNPKGLKLKPIKRAKLPYICIRGTSQDQGEVSRSKPSIRVNPDKAASRRVPYGMNEFVNYYELLHIDRNASHMTVSRAWEKYATKQFDPLIEHKDADKELNDFILWHDVREWLLIDEYTRAFYNSKLEQFERMSAAGLARRGGYHEVFFAYDSEDDDWDSEEAWSPGLG